VNLDLSREIIKKKRQHVEVARLSLMLPEHLMQCRGTNGSGRGSGFIKSELGSRDLEIINSHPAAYSNMSAQTSLHAHGCGDHAQEKAHFRLWSSLCMHITQSKSWRQVSCKSTSLCAISGALLSIASKGKNIHFVISRLQSPQDIVFVI